MKILVDARVMRGPISGIGRYALSLYEAVLKIKTQEKILFFNGNDIDKGHLILKDSSAKSTKSHLLLERVKVFVDKSFPFITLTKKKLALAKAEKILQASILQYDVSIYHSPNFLTLLKKPSIPEFITVPDVSCARSPEFHPESRLRFFEKYLPKSLEQSTHILTISEFSKQEIIDCFGINANKISVTYMGVSNVFKPYQEKSLSKVLTHYGLEYKKYFLYTGNIEPRKNLELLLAIFAKFFNRPELKDYKLVIAGNLGWKYSSFEDKLKNSPARSKIVLTGYVPSDMLPMIMSGSFCFLYPSFYEGFGIPPLEAMASGVPVITTNTTSLPEVVGDAGITKHPEDVDGWFDSICRLIDDNALYHTYVERGLLRKQLFSWECCAIKTLQSFRTFG